MGNLFDQFKLLLYKNFLLQKRRTVPTFFEIFIPLLFSFLLLWIRFRIKFDEQEDMRTWRTFQVDQLPPFIPDILPADETLIIGYAPNNSDTNEIMAKVSASLSTTSRTPTWMEEQCNYNRDDVIASPATWTTKPMLAVRGCLLRNLKYAVRYPKGKRRRRGEPKPDIDTRLEENYGIDPTSMKDIVNLFGIVPKVRVMGFPTEADFETYVKEDSVKKKTLTGVIFNNDFSINDVNVKYRFHDMPFNQDPVSQRNRFRRIVNPWRTNSLFPRVQVPGPRESSDFAGGNFATPRYYREGFLSVMHAVNMAIADVSSNQTNEDVVKLKRYPYPPHINDRFIVRIQSMLPFMIMLSFLYSALSITRSIVQEKESRMKEYMIMMGLPKWLLWLSWYVKYMIFLSISVLLITMMYKIPISVRRSPGKASILRFSNPAVIILFLMMFCSAVTTFSFVLSTLFQKAHVAAPATGVLYFVSYFPCMFKVFEDSSSAMKMFGCLLPNVALGLGCEELGNFEGQETGAQWHNINQGVTVDNDFTFLKVIIMLIVDTVLYMALTFYIENVYPGQFGIPKPLYYPFQKSYWSAMFSSRQAYQVDGRPINISQKKEYFEPEPTNLQRVAEISNMKKVFTGGPRTKVAVDNLNLNMYKNQITVLLGHNGAGKTTTMSMLTGFLPPTSGDAIINGCSIRGDIDGVRQSMGLCPQFNILFDSLTVNEHLYFFARLKGLTPKEAIQQCEEMKTALELQDKSFFESSRLSGGMKRKLSVGIALSAGSEYIILDEPTSGMDPAARRALWKVLMNFKSRCSILLSTHFMDEADLLGDRIAIMANGKLRCAGSSAFLKNQFGVGYHIVLTKTPECNLDQLTNMFQRHVGAARLKRTAGAEVSYLLPFTATGQFPQLFTELEERSEELGITSYGATITTMEEVFLRVTEDADESMPSVMSRLSIAQSGTSFLKGGNNGGPSSDDLRKKVSGNMSKGSARYEDLDNIFIDISPQDTNQDTKRNTGFKLWSQQFYSLLMKKIIHSKRNYKVSLSQLMLPVICAMLVVISIKNPRLTPESKPRSLSLQSYGSNEVFYNQSDVKAPGLASVYSSMFDGVVTSQVKNGDLENIISDARKVHGFSSGNLVSASFDQVDMSNPNCTNIATPAQCRSLVGQCNNATFLNTSTIQPWQCNRTCGNCEANIMNPEGALESIAWFNNHAYHSIASSLLYLDQAYIRYVSNGTNDNFSINVINFPLPKNSSNKMLEELLLGQMGGFQIASSCILGFSFLSATFVIFLVREREDRAKLLQTLAGVDPLCYWTSTFTWDFINFIIPCLICILIFVACTIKQLADNSGAVLMVFIAYCWASLAMTYCFSYLFKVPSTGFVRVFLFNYITGLAGMITTMIMGMLDSDSFEGVQAFFTIFPSFAMGQGLSDIYLNAEFKESCQTDAMTAETCEQMNYTFQDSALAWERYGVGKFVTAPFIEGIILFGFLFLCEYNVLGSISFKSLSNSQVFIPKTPDDADVAQEKTRINKTPLDELKQTDCLIVQAITKIYKKSSFESHLAVDHLSVGIPKGECFGLLGINGAGKTTTFKMLTGDFKPTSGTAYLDGFDMKKNLRQVQQRIGYCPQFDALIDQMTGRETLTMYARLRGVPEENINASIAKLGTALHFAEHMEKPCGTYSGGNKRKLSTAISLVGEPSIVLLDEPSTGMDPGAKRKLWDALCDVRTSGRAIVITSHSMEECEALCTRLAIMVNGRFRCIGGAQHLKTKFGKGYNLEIKVPAEIETPSQLQQFIETAFPGNEYNGFCQNLLKYHLPEHDGNGQPLKLAKVFEVMEEGRAILPIQEYTVAQSSLEQVFLNLVQFQQEVED